MASKVKMDARNQAQDVMRCDLCRRSVVQMHCDTCLLFLCKACVGEHISSDECEDHKIGKLKSGKSVLVYPMCALHDNKRCEMHCQECKIPVCLTCATSEKHGGHRFKKIVNIFYEKKREFERKIKDLQENIRGKHVEQALKMKRGIADLEREFMTLSDNVFQHGEELKREVDKVVKQLQSEIESIKENHMELLTTSRTEVQHNLTEIDREVSSLKETLESNVINKVFQFSPNDKISKNLPDEPELTMPVFYVKRIYSVQLRKMFGTLLSNVTTKPTAIVANVKLMETPIMVHRFETGYNQLYGVALLDRIGIWAAGDARQILLFDVHGKSTTKSISTKLLGEKLVSLTNEGYLLYAKKGGRTIHMVKHEQCEEFINVQDWKVHGLCVTSDGNLLVVMTSGRRETRVVRYHGREQKEIIQFDSEGKPFYSVGINQKYICENGNFDICVADRDAFAVVVVSHDRKLQFRYEGNPSSLRPSAFIPKGVATNSLCNILVSDIGNACVHVIDQYGKFLKIIDCPNAIPWGLCAALDDYLYVADNASSDVIKIRYLQ